MKSTQPKYSLGRDKRLKSQILIEKLFAQGASISKYPVRLVYLYTGFDKDESFQAGFSVPKKKFKRAVDRNRIKRWMREAFRKQQYNLSPDKKLIMMWIYTGKELTDYHTIYQSIKSILEKISQESGAQPTSNQ